MEIFRHKLNQKVGLPPGSLFYTGQKSPSETKFQLIAYNEDSFTRFESFGEMLSGLMELYMSNLSHSQNQVMKTLTIVATIFIPLTFIVGVYGMNFQYMPELSWYWGYLYIWIFMVLSVIIMIIVMKRKNWF